VPEFVCRIGAPDGSVMEQRRLAASAEALRRELETEGFHIFSLASAGSQLKLPFVSRREKVSGKEFLLFNTQLRTLLRAGMPLAQSLDLLKGQQASPVFCALLNKVHQQVTTGISLSDAFLSLGETFPALYANSLRAGERSGELPAVLERYIQYQQLVEAARRKIVGALTYPAVLVLMSICLVVILLWKVIPKFAEFYLGFGSKLPLPTRIVLGLGDFVQHNMLWIALVVVGGFIGLRLWAKTPQGRLLIDRWRLSVPAIGRLSHLFALSQFTRSLGILLNGGTPMVPALETASRSIGNTFLSEMILHCVPSVQQGQALSDTLEGTGKVPGLALAMIRVGESTGALPEMLSHTSDFFDEEIEFSLARIVTLFEPAILVFMGLIVAGLLLSVYYPLLTMVSRF
jgi:type IV pilus assembly protein PilC